MPPRPLALPSIPPHSTAVPRGLHRGDVLQDYRLGIRLRRGRLSSRLGRCCQGQLGQVLWLVWRDLQFLRWLWLGLCPLFTVSARAHTLTPTSAQRAPPTHESSEHAHPSFLALWPVCVGCVGCPDDLLLRRQFFY